MNISFQPGHQNEMLAFYISVTANDGNVKMCTFHIMYQHFYAICHIKFRLRVYKLTFISRGGGYGDGMTAGPDGRQALFSIPHFKTCKWNHCTF